MRRTHKISRLVFVTGLIILLSCNTLSRRQRTYPSKSESIKSLFYNSYKMFEFLRTDQGVYADAARFEGEQFHPVSIATIGVGLISVCIANEMNWINNAEELVLQTLNTISGNTRGFSPERNKHGFFRHWINAQNGSREWNSEFSSIDTGILVSGALFCKEYFSSNLEIKKIATSLYESINWSSAIANAETGEIYMTFKTGGEGINTTRPFNEYMIVAWLAMNYKQNNLEATKLWNNYYSSPIFLPKSSFNNIEVLTDRPGHFLSSFVIQFPYYMCNYFMASEEYLRYFDNAMVIDKMKWQEIDKNESFVWGTGAGASPVESGYHADNINSNPGNICSPHIIAGFVPINPESLDDLEKLITKSEAIYEIPENQNLPIIWRFSSSNDNWRASDIQGIDFSTMLFGIASHPNFLGIDFFSKYNDFKF